MTFDLAGGPIYPGVCQECGGRVEASDRAGSILTDFQAVTEEWAWLEDGGEGTVCGRCAAEKKAEEEKEFAQLLEDEGPFLPDDEDP